MQRVVDAPRYAHSSQEDISYISFADPTQKA